LKQSWGGKSKLYEVIGVVNSYLRRFKKDLDQKWHNSTIDANKHNFSSKTTKRKNHMLMERPFNA
jgi:hypothetical protein